MFNDDYIIEDIIEKHAGVNKDEVVKIERDLIEKAQRNDFMAMNKLIQMYRGTITNCIKNSGILSVMDYNTAHGYALKSFKKTIKENFSLGNKTAKPVTYITNSLVGDLKKVMADNMNTAVVGSQDLQRKSKAKNIAEKLLFQQNGVQPTNEEVLNFIKTEMKMGSDITLDNLNRIDMYKTKELSSNTLLSQGDKNAQAVTFADVMNVKKESPKDVIDKQREEQMLLNHLDRFTQSPIEKRFIQNMYGFGEFKGEKSKSLNSAAINAGITAYEGIKIVARYKDSLKKEGVI
ncbi:MAG: hypothetical protein RR420_00700 [Anaerovoracaceae bacterium]